MTSTATDPAADAAVVRCSGVSKSFGAIQALDGADLTVPAGRIVALVGENGAGKSTLVRLIAGEISADSGTVDVRTSIGVVRQQLSTVPELSVLENVVIGGERRRGTGSTVGRVLGRIDWRAARKRAAELAERTGLDVPLSRRAGDLPAGVQQRAELLGALYRGATCLLLDEPTTYLTPHEVDRLFGVVRRLAADGLAAVFISHKLREVAAHCDEVAVLRRGRSTAFFGTRPFDLAAIGRAMTGGGNDPSAPAPVVVTGQVGSVSDTPALTCIRGRLTVRRGEIVGVAGVAGNGQDELFSTVAGVSRDSRFEPVILGAADLSRSSSWQRRLAGLRLIPSNVRAAGSVPSASLADNVISAMVPPRHARSFGRYSRSSAVAETHELIKSSGIVARGPEQLAGELSGGNLQRLAVARELNGNPAVVLAHEPTRGVDFAASHAIRDRLREFARQGGAVLLLTSDLDELLALSTRVHVLYDGTISDPYERCDLTLARLGELLGGLSVDRGGSRS